MPCTLHHHRGTVICCALVICRELVIDLCPVIFPCLVTCLSLVTFYDLAVTCHDLAVTCHDPRSAVVSCVCRCNRLALYC